MSAQQPYTGRSVFDSLSASPSPAPAGAPAAPSEPGVLLVFASGAREFVACPKEAAEKVIALLETWPHATRENESPLKDLKERLFIRSERVDFARVTTEAKAEKAPAAVEAAVAQAVAAAAKATVAAEDANAAADEVLDSVTADGDVSGWTDEQIADSIASLRHKIDNKVIGPDETQQALTDAMMEVVRLDGILKARRAAGSTTSFGTVVPPGTAN